MTEKPLSNYCGNCRARLPKPDVWGMCERCKDNDPKTNHNNYCERCSVPLGAGGYDKYCESHCVACCDLPISLHHSEDYWKPWVATDCVAWQRWDNPDDIRHCPKCHKRVCYGQRCHRGDYYYE